MESFTVREKILWFTRCLNIGIKLEFKYTGAPLASVTWQKDGAVLPVSTRFMVGDDGFLNILSTAAEDGGVYTVTLSNGFSTATGSTRLDVLVGSCDFETNLCDYTIPYDPVGLDQ